MTLKTVENMVEKIFGDMELVKIKKLSNSKFVVWTDFDKLEDAMEAEDEASYDLRNPFYVIVEDPQTALSMIHELYDFYCFRRNKR